MKKSSKKFLKVDGSLITSPKYEVVEQITYKDGNREYLIFDCEKGGWELMKSVTSALPKPPEFVLTRWREKVGVAYANFSTKASSSFGNRMHDSVTRLYEQVESYENHLFEKFFDEIAYVIASEVEVVSKELGVAGTFDLLVMNKKGEVELIDLKNHSRIHPLKEVKNNLLELPQEIQSAKKKKWKQQGACYIKGLKETYNINVDRFSVWCYNQGTGKIEKPVNISGGKLEKELSSVKDKLEIN